MSPILSKLMNERFLRESLFDFEIEKTDKEREIKFYNRRYKIENIYDLYKDLTDELDDELFVNEIYIFAIENRDKDYFKICHKYSEVIHKTLKQLQYDDCEIEYATLYFIDKFLRDEINPGN